ncbi:MAG: hypothetical protein ACE15B_24240 [Bryobacteraceae bacterium]
MGSFGAKQWKLTEYLTLRYQTQFLNALNHVCFAGPNLSSTSTSFGRVTRRRWCRPNTRPLQTRIFF